MKEIRNFRQATVFDIEADGLLEEATKIHTLSFQMSDKDKPSTLTSTQRIVKFFQHHIDNNIPVVAHNGICYDIPVVEELLGLDLSSLMVIDTLALSYYLNYDRQSHGLASFLEDYGIEKIKVDDDEWIAPVLQPHQSQEEYETLVSKHLELMTLRCEEDVKINVALYNDFKERLTDMYELTKNAIDNGVVDCKRTDSKEEVYLDRFVGLDVDSHINNCLTFLMFKMDMLALKEKTKWKIDIDYINKSISELSPLLQEKADKVESIMPPVPKYGTRKKPTGEMYKKDGSVRKSYLDWWELETKLEQKDHLGNDLVVLTEEGAKVIIRYEPPKIGSVVQMKALLFSKGWKPETFEFKKDKKAMDEWAKAGFPKDQKPQAKAIPKITIDGDEGKELCPSVLRLCEEHPELNSYADYNLIKHRLGILESFLEAEQGSYVKARVGGFTNTLRLKHREVVNLPSVSRPYGELVRGALTCEDNEILLGSDLSSLEDRVKHHFMLPHDPKYVATMMSDDYDPHILTAHSAGLIDNQELEQFKAGHKTEKVSNARKAGKATNYACVYGAAPATIARSAGVDEDTAKLLHKGYWQLNWSVNEIAKEQTVFECHGTWLVNPINGLCYSLRKEKDRFSTLCQGTGSYLFDMWIDTIQSKMQERFKVKRLVGDFHDEYITRMKDTPNNREIMEEITETAIKEVTSKYLLRRELGCDVQFGKRYSDIH